MKWVRVHNNASLENFELWDDQIKLAGIAFSNHTRFARFVCNMTKRIFSFEKRGFLSVKEIIRNEYGIKMGEVEETKPGGKRGHIILEEKKYNYVFTENTSGELLLYDDLMQNCLLNCSFSGIFNGLTKTNSLLETRFASLLLVLCWYTFQTHNNAITKMVS